MAKGLGRALEKEIDDGVQKGAKSAAAKAGKILGAELGEGAERAGEEAGKKYAGKFRTELGNSLKSLSKELDPIQLRTDDRELASLFEHYKAEAKALSKIQIKPGMDTSEIERRAAEVAVFLKRTMRDQDFRVGLDATAATAGLERLERQIQKLDHTAKVDVDTKPAERKLGAFEQQLKNRLNKAGDAIGDSVNRNLQEVQARLQSLNLKKIGIDVTAKEAEKEIRSIEIELARLAATTIDIQVNADATAALLAIESADRAREKLDGKRARIKVDADNARKTEKDLSLLGRAFQRLSLDGRDTANSFRFFNGAALAVSATGAGLVPILALISGGLLGAAVAALGLGAALGVMLIGFSGIGDAVTALGDQQKNAAKDSQAAAKRMRNAAEQVEDAERALARTREDVAQRAADAEQAVVDAKEQAARSIESALRRQEDAERRLSKANEDAAQAQKDLTQARIDAQKELDEIAAKQKRNRLDERQGVLDLFTATVENDAAQRDPGATNFEKEQASINLENAKLRLEDIRKEEKELADQRKKGVNDSDKVKNAQDRVTSALEAQQEAQRGLVDAERELNQARIDGARSVADAIKAQKRAQQDNSEALEDAQRRLTQAQLDYKDALVETNELGSASAQKLADAMGKLSPAGQAFALFIHGLADDFERLRAVIQEGFLPGLQDALQTLIDTYGEDFIKFAGEMAKLLGELAKQAAAVFTNKEWKAFFKMVGDIAPIITKQFGEAFINWLSAFANLAVAAAPFALLVSEALLDISKRVLEWTRSKEGQKLIQDFFAYLVEVAPTVRDFFKALALALLAVVEALAMFGPDILKVLTDILNWIAGLDPKTIATVIGAILTLIGAFQALSGIIALVSVIFSPIGAWVLIALALVAALVYLYKTNEDFAKLVQDVWPVVEWIIVHAFQLWAWNMGLVIGVLSDLQTALVWFWDEVLSPFLDWATENLQAFWEDTAKPVLTDIKDLFSEMGGDIKWVWENVIWPVLDVLGRILWQLWNLTVGPVLRAVGKLFDDTWKLIKLGWETILKPVFDTIADKLGVDDAGKEKGGGLVGAFRSAISLIKTIWEGLGNTLKAPVTFMVDTIINKGLIAGFNGLANHLPGLKPVEPIPWPPAGFANGGIPDKNYGVRFGYTPGRDNQLIAVGGGEAILRPEATRVLGPGWVNAINKRAKLQGTQGVANYLGGYYEGGVVPASSVGEFDKTTWRGKRFNYRTIRMLQAAERLSQQTLRITQGSYSTSVAASGSTHAGGGAFDAGWPGGLLGQALVFALRTVGFAAWHRNSSQGPWNPHIHGIAAGDPTASDAAKRQVADYYAGGDGLGGKDDGPNVKKDPSLLEKIKGGLSGIVGWVSDAISNPVDWLRGKISDKLGKLTEDWGDNTLTKTLKAIPEAIITGMGQMITGFLPGQSEESWTPIAGGLKEMVATMAKTMFGWEGNQWSALAKIVQAESGWDPNAQNPSSTAYGLFQFLNGTWGPYGKKTSDPQLQAQYGLQYIKDRYGDPQGALNFREDHGWYSDGGTVPDNGTMMYDNGGYLPPGITRVVNLTGRPEPVFTEDQFSSMGAGSKGDGFTYAPTFNQSDLTAGDVADDLAFTWKRIDDGVFK
jgi:hypothetical protein